MVDQERMKQFNEIFAKSDYKGKYSYVDSSSMKEIDELLKSKNTQLHSHALFAAIWRAALDTHTTHNLLPVVNFILDEIKSDKLDLTKGKNFQCDVKAVFQRVVEFILFCKMENRELDKYNWRGEALSLEYVMNKFEPTSHTVQEHGGRKLLHEGP